MRKLLWLAPLGVLLMLAVLGVSIFAALIPGFSAPSGSNSLLGCTSGATGQLSAAQVAQYAAAAGFSDTGVDQGTGQSDLVVAVAITRPESGANSSAVQDGGPIGGALIGVGLWQITPGTTADLDPAANAKDAYAKFAAAHGFSPWTTYPGSITAADWAWAKAGVMGMSTTAGGCTAGSLTAGPAGPVGSVTAEPTPAGLPATFDSYPAGQCTFFAAWERAQLGKPVPPDLGNAAQWVSIATSQQPADSEVVVYGANNGYSPFGHVAVVSAVQGQDFEVIEMNYLGPGIVDQRWSSMTDVVGFIK